jgi:hypothetical protein
MATRTAHLDDFHVHLSRRDGARTLSTLLTLFIASAYGSLFFLVRAKELNAGVETSYGAYLFLAIAYFVGVAVLATRDRRDIELLGAVVQVGVLTLFVVFAIGTLDGPGLFEYELLEPLRMGWWSAGIGASQVLLLGLLSWLASGPRRNDL